MTSPHKPTSATWVWYVGMLAAAVGLFLCINAWGTRLAAPPATGPAEATAHRAAPASGGSDAVLHVLVALTAVIVTGRLLAFVLRYAGQPAVIGDIVAGIVLGPSLLGRVSPAAAAFVLPASVAPHLAMIAQLGVILYMFLVGLELNPSLLRSRAHATVAISHASIVAPFLLGSALALFLYPRMSNGDVRFTSFALFMGVAMSITAFPVLARILADLDMQKTPLGVVALGCAATDDATAWCLLAFVVGVAQAKMGGALVVLAETAGFIAFMLVVARPIAARCVARIDKSGLSPGIVALVLAALFCSALATELIGIHAVFGAFLMGAVIPHDSALAQGFTQRLEDLVTVLLLPAFFAFTGMRTEIGLLAEASQWVICGLIVLVATAGKFGGSLAAARLTGLSWRDSTALGLLLNTRGLMELIALNVGLDLKVISPELFAMMVLMALVTTMTAGPIVKRLSCRPAGVPA